MTTVLILGTISLLLLNFKIIALTSENTRLKEQNTKVIEENKKIKKELIFRIENEMSEIQFILRNQTKKKYNYENN